MKLLSTYRAALEEALRVARDFGWDSHWTKRACSDDYGTLDDGKDADECEENFALNNLNLAWRDLRDAEHAALKAAHEGVK